MTSVAQYLMKCSKLMSMIRQHFRFVSMLLTIISTNMLSNMHMNVSTQPFPADHCEEHHTLPLTDLRPSLLCMGLRSSKVCLYTVESIDSAHVSIRTRPKVLLKSQLSIERCAFTVVRVPLIRKNSSVTKISYANV